jgi:hypothetical protein
MHSCILDMYGTCFPSTSTVYFAIYILLCMYTLRFIKETALSGVPRNFCVPIHRTGLTITLSVVSETVAIQLRFKSDVLTIHCLNQLSEVLVVFYRKFSYLHY